MIPSFTLSTWSEREASRRQSLWYPLQGSMVKSNRVGEWIWCVLSTLSVFSRNWWHSGDIIHLDVAGLHLIYLNSYEMAIELLERRSVNYSSRRSSEMAKLSASQLSTINPFYSPPFLTTDSTNFNKMFALHTYGDKWRTYRQLFHQEFNNKSIERFDSTLLETSR